VDMAARSTGHSLDKVNRIVKALADPQRIAIVRLVHERELPAGEIAEHFQTTRQTTSQHLRVLTNAGLLSLRRDGTRRLYRVNREAFGELRTFVDIFWNDRLSLLKRQVEEDKGTQRGKR